MEKYLSFIAIIILFIQTDCINSNKDNPEKWFLKATYHEACSCNAPCPCPFGLPMTNSYCKLNGLVLIHEGQYEDIDLSGLKAVLSGSVGSWGEYYFTETISDIQKDAFEKILKTINITHFDSIAHSEKTKINYSKTKSEISYSTSKIDVKLNTIIGANNKPVEIKNLNGKTFKNYIPHLSIKNKRTFQDTINNFSFPQKAGFTSEWDLSENDYK